MKSEQFINKYGETYFKAEKLGSFYKDVHKLISCEKESIKNLERVIREQKETIDLFRFQVKKAKDSIESLLVLIDSRLALFDGEVIGKGKSLIWKRVVKTAQNLIKEK